MPWSDYPADVRQFSGLVQAAAEQRFGSAATVEVIAQSARDAGIKLSFQSYSALASMYGQYVGVRTAREKLSETIATASRQGVTASITSDMIARPPWAPPVTSSNLNPFVMVRATYTMDSPEGPITGYFSHRYSLSDLHTTAQITQDMQLQIDQGAGGSNLEGAQLDQIVGIEWSTP